jgi:hypothetical protein
MATLSRPWGIAVLFGVAAAISAGSAWALDTGNGSKNFSVPGNVPNYFANESGPMVGGSAESRRGELYSSQTQASAPARPAVVATSPAEPRGRTHIAMAVPSRGRSVHGSRGASVHHAAAVHGRVSAHGGHVAVAHASGKSTRTAIKASTHATTSHRRGRG